MANKELNLPWVGTYLNHGSYSNKYVICLYSLSCIITRKFSLFFFGSVDTLLTIPLAQLVKTYKLK